MHRYAAISLAHAALLAVLAMTRWASAQVDVSPPLPNVLLLVDTSGSMEYAIDGSRVACDKVDSSLTTEPQATSQKNRWTQLVEVLVGNIAGYQCRTVDRRSADFRNEYQLLDPTTSTNASPPDYNYVVPHHRMLYPFAAASSSSATSTEPCTIGPGTPDANAFAWSSNSFSYHVWNNPSIACAPPQPSATGLLDAFADRARFALMTFDTQTDPGTGLGSGTTPNYATGTSGTWSYFLDWATNSSCPAAGGGNPSCARGNPADCLTKSVMEVGARNAAAPPWEGRMLGFSVPTASIADVHENTRRIKQVLLATRPFGGTPISGMLADARDFLTLDTSNHPTSTGTCGEGNAEACFGPKYDPYIGAGCRKSHIILLTDGEPNLDLRPWCEGAGGQCPYSKKPEEIVDALAHPASGTNAITTFVVGFAVSSVDIGGPVPVDCSKLSTPATGTTPAVFDPQGYCGSAMNPKLSACCTLAKIAFYGGTENAHFASSASELRSALSDILSHISTTATSRTVPVYGSVSSSSGGSYTFYSSFNVATGAMWRGNLQRERTTCVTEKKADGTTSTTPKVQPISEDAGDDFAYNVNHASNDPTHPRHYYTVIAEKIDNAIASDRSIRPAITANIDGIGTRLGTLVDGTNDDFYETTKVPASAMRVTKAACSDPAAASDDECASRILKWVIGVSNGSLPNRVGNVFGDVYHATPVLVAPPNESLRDESYNAFAAGQQKRPTMLYAATNDGQLHAFKVLANDPADTFKVDKSPVQNELWSFFPPAVLPRLVAEYPNTHQLLLDGPPVVKDVIFERTQASAVSGGAAGDWHTVLVEGFGAGGGGYYALDITNPVPVTGKANTGPQFLWQLTTDSGGNQLFGAQSGTPVITTLYFDRLGDGNPTEQAVAILPGGSGAGSTGWPCDQQGSVTYVDTRYPPRDKVQCWANDPARSVTVVLLKTGEIIRTFRAAADGPSSILVRAGEVGKYAKLNAPMTGRPVTFTAQTGTVADRAFLGDADGMLWRLDLSSTKPTEWKIDLWFDAYSPKAAGTTTAGLGQPIVTAPVLSVDGIGNVTIAFSTGDQETFNYVAGMKNFLYSLKENPSSTPPFQSQLQWYSQYDNGTRVSGPIQIYASVLYYTTVTPTPASDRTQVCQAGSSSLCGVHYLAPNGEATSGNGGLAGLPPDTGQKEPRQCLSLGNTVAFGAAITQTPTCSAAEVYNDPYLGLPNHMSLRGGITGGGSSVVANGASTTAGTTKKEIVLGSPSKTTRIDSWASVID